MNLVPKREYLALLIGDMAVFGAALWVTLTVRYLTMPSMELFNLHFVPFSLLFVVWLAVFFLAGLYRRHTQLFRRHLLSTIFTMAL